MISPKVCSTTSTSNTTTAATTTINSPPTSSILINKDKQSHHHTPIITFQQAAADSNSKIPTSQLNSVHKSKTETSSIMEENPRIIIPTDKNCNNSVHNFEEVYPEETDTAEGLSGIESHFFEGVEKLLEVWFTQSSGGSGEADLRK